MCMLTYFPPGTEPDLDALANGAEFNDDGHGFAIVTGGRIIVRHGMDSARLIERFGETRAQHPDGPALFHSRFATHGTRNRGNCHPFRVGHDARTVLAHNGILPHRVRPADGDRRSDTRIAAEDFLPHQRYSAWDDPHAQRDLSRWLGTSNKMLILTVDPRYREHAYLFNEQAGIWDHGIWYSTADYQGYIHGGAGVISAMSDPDAYWACPVCLTHGGIGEDGYCLVCGGCGDCAEPDGYCVCYAPGRFADSGTARWRWSSLTGDSSTAPTLTPAPQEVSRWTR